MKNLLYVYKIIVYKVDNNVYCREKEEKKQEKTSGGLKIREEVTC